jgi:hypothetical protein
VALNSNVLGDVVCRQLTPTGLFLLQSRVSLTFLEGGVVLAYGREYSESFEYADVNGVKGKTDKEQTTQWLGLSYDVE